MSLFAAMRTHLRCRGLRLALFVVLWILFHNPIVTPPSLAATFEVNALSDACPVAPPGTLRWAINQANLNPGSDTIVFTVAGTINLACDLPPLVSPNGDGTLIQGDSAPGSCVSAPKIILDGGALALIGLDIMANDCVVRGLGFVNLGTAVKVQDGQRNQIGDTGTCQRVRIDDGGVGVSITGPLSEDNKVQNCVIFHQDQAGIELTQQTKQDTLGGFGDMERNYVFENYGDGIVLVLASECWVAGNHVGLDPNGMARGNERNGIDISAGSVSNLIEGNVVVDNDHQGINMTDAGTGNTILDNWIGTDEMSRVGLGNGLNGIRVALDAIANIDGNVIASNGLATSSSGILLQTGADNCTIVRNWIGTDGTADLGNHRGILIQTSGNVIGDVGMGNTIGFNEEWGIEANNSTTISGNKILYNYIGTNMTLSPMPNGSGGILFGLGLVNNDIGSNTIHYHLDFPGVRVGNAGAGVTPIENRILDNLMCFNGAWPLGFDRTGWVRLFNGGNDEINAPTIQTAWVQTGTVTGVTNLPSSGGFRTVVQVFYESPTFGCGFVGETPEITTSEWSVAGWYPWDAHLCAFNTSSWPRVLSSPKQTSECGDYRARWVQATTGFPLGDDAAATFTSALDYDNDGDPDIWISNDQGPNRLYRNLGGYNFEEAAIGDLAAIGKPNTSATWGDGDNDGDQDVYLLHVAEPNQLFRNDGELGFTDVTPAILADPGMGRSAAWMDVDADGRLDLVMVDRNGFLLEFRNDGDLGFSPGHQIIFEGSRWNYLAPADYDLDGDPDLYVARRDFANSLYRNDGIMGFTEVTTPELADPGRSYSAAWGDFDNDNLLDLCIANGDGPNRLVRNLGDGSWEEVDDPAVQHAGNGRGVTWGDIENDGDLDLYVVNFQEPNVLLFNEGPGGFIEADPGAVTLADMGSGLAAAMADFEQDGDLDIFLINNAVSEPNLLFVNAQNSVNHWLQADLIGTQSNRFGVGARCNVTIIDQPAIITREVGTGAGLSQNCLTASIGLDDFVSFDGGAPDTVATIDTLRVHWPSGIVQLLTGVEVDRRIVLREPTGAAVEPVAAAPITTGLLSSLPNPFNPSTQVHFELAEPGAVSLRVFDSSGRLVKVLVDSQLDAGTHSVIWDARDQSGLRLAKGVFYLELNVAGRRYTQKTTLLY